MRSQTSEEVHDVISRAAYFSIFSVPEPDQLSVGVPLLPFVPALLYKIKITESPRRHQVQVPAPSPICGFQSIENGSNRRMARQSLLLEMMPNNFQPALGRTPWQIPLLPFLSQRFYMSEGIFDFLDPESSGFRAHAVGRFFPTQVAGQLHIRIGSIVEILHYLGRLQGHVGNLVVNGYTTPPEIFANNFIIRFVDIEGRLTSDQPLPTDEPLPDPEPGIGFLPLLSRLKPGAPLSIELGGDGKARVTLIEEVSIADSSFDVRPRLISRTVPGPVVGEHKMTLVFDPNDPNNVIPLFSLHSEFRFFADGHAPIGTLKVNFVEGRAFPTKVPQLPRPFFRITGYGPFLSGTGQFQNAVGMASMNGALSLSPGAVSSMYMLRIADPDGRFRPAALSAAA
jgi:hypothetical protein